MKFPELDDHIAWVASASIGLIAAFIVYGAYVVAQHEQCRQAGGVPIKIMYKGVVCLDRDAVIDYEEQPR